MKGTKFLTVMQAAAELQCSRQAIQSMIDEERLHALWILERWAIPECEVRRLIKERASQALSIAMRKSA